MLYFQAKKNSGIYCIGNIHEQTLQKLRYNYGKIAKKRHKTLESQYLDKEL